MIISFRLVITIFFIQLFDPGCSVKIAKTILSYAGIIAVGLLIGYVAPRLPMWLKPAYQEGDYSTHFQNTKSKVLLYGTVSCSFCQKTRAYFDENKIEFVELDVEKSPAAAARHAELGGEGVPVVIIDKRMIRGYQPEVFQQALQAMAKMQTAAK